ncbi:hypothetical protein MNBD_GAMMA01-203 [hydrothermal vent metagenome]|uniref:OmpA-like domain-containing protein n=1 Tax=hydrothermal vent metagenome TaxID=652676 RepID=A0A3B0VRS9_9ZZZZ
MNTEHEILKNLLLKEELELLDTLKQKLLSQKQFTKEVSAVLAAAINRAQKQNKEFEKALSLPIKNGVKRAFSESKQSIIDALLPIMGQLIRKTVTNSIRQFVTDINRTIELGFSSKALKWRWQAYKAGIPFAEIVFQKTIRYQVSELFVINRENGLLIAHVGANDMLKDNNAISAMLTVIQDFIGDSLRSEDSGLLSAEIDDNLILISTGPKAYLASVIKGSPTGRLKQKSQQLIENIHADFSEILVDEDKYQNIVEFDDYLRPHLITKSLLDNSEKINWLPWVVILILLVSGLSYWSYQRTQQFNAVVDIAKSTPGFFMQSVIRKNSGYEVTGLLDPIADISQLQTEHVKLQTRPFISLDHEIVQQRVLNILINYPTVKAVLQNNIVVVSGKISRENRQKLLQQLHNIIGINTVEDNLNIDNREEIKSFLQDNVIVNQIEYTLSANKLTLQGNIKFQDYQNFKSGFNAIFPDVIIDEENINIINSTDNLIAFINQTSINLSKYQQGDQTQKQQLQNVINSSHSLISRKGKIHVAIIGKSDCYGKDSDKYSLDRAKAIKQIFIQQGVNQNFLAPKIKPCVTFNNHPVQAKLTVAFKLE